MRQGITESDDKYLPIFNSRYKVLELAGGGHIFCSPEILGKTIHDATNSKVKTENNIFSGDVFFNEVRRVPLQRIN